MTDLEITRLCAEAMGCKWKETSDGIYVDSFTSYDPIHDDAQCMALVKRFKLMLVPNGTLWEVGPENGPLGRQQDANNPDLNRAVCLCIAKMQAKR